MQLLFAGHSSTAKTAPPGSAFCVRRGAASVSPNFMPSPVRTMHPARLAPVAELLRDRLDLLSIESRKASQRVLAAFASVAHLRNKLPAASPGTILQQLWLSLGGDRCVDATGRANLDLFWKLLDELPGGEQDLTGAALGAALEDLFALPDPATSSDCGVQLMTIHKSKGLEFEVVIVPDLHARGGSSKSDLLSWLERGIAEPDESGDLTEFLIAPVQFKGADRRQSQAMGRQDSPRTGIAGDTPHSLRRRHARPRRAASFCPAGVQNRRRRIVLLAGTAQLSAGHGMACLRR